MFYVYEKNETNFNTFGLAVLKDIESAEIHKKINGDFSLSFLYPIRKEDPNLEYIKHQNIIKADGQLFRIKTIREIDEGQGLWLEVKAPHIFFDLIDYFSEDTRAKNATIQRALEILLSDTPFKVGRCDDLGVNNAYYVEENKLKSLNDKIIPRWNAEIDIDNFTVTAKRQIGLDRKFHIRKGKNLRSINTIEDISPVITRLYVKGYDGLTFADINGGKWYVESENINKYTHVKEDIITFGEIEDKHKLLEKAKEYIKTIDTPYFSMNVDLVELRSSEQYKYFRDLEKVDLGDSGIVYHEELGVNIASRVVEYTYDPIVRVNSRVVLGNFTETLEETLADFDDVRDKLSNILIGDRVNAAWLEGIINLLNNKLEASAAYNKAQVIEDIGILLENTKEDSEDYGALYLGPGIFAIASEKKEDNTWNWRTFGTGKGFTADMINTGILNAELIKTGRLQSFKGTVYIDFDEEVFRIGGRSGNITEITNDYGKWLHDDGSYTKISSKGLERYDSGTGKQYHYMTKIIKFTAGGDNQAPSTKWIPIGKEFNNKKWSAALSISDSMDASSNVAAIHRIVLTQSVTANGTTIQPRFRNGQWEVPVMGYKTNVNAVEDSRRYGPVAGIMIVTA